MFYLAYNLVTGEGRVFTIRRHAVHYAAKRGWRCVRIGLIA